MTAKPLWVNILFSIVLVTIVILLFLVSLNFITRHGSTLTIPSVTGKSFAEATRVLEGQGFEVQLQDSIYNDTAQALSVLRQFPEADEVVKRNRTVYLTINRSVPPTIEMPLLEGLSFRSAEVVLKQYSLKRGDTSYRMDLAKNSVLEQIFNGVRIKPGSKLPMGSVIDLVLGTGEGDEFMVPDLFGMPYSEAKVMLEGSGFAITAIPDGGVVDTTAAFVYRQQPEKYTTDGRANRIRQGQNIAVWIGIERPVRQVDSIPQ
ncbi:MAG: PASTA domain-containing protein [Chitinophagaceae bacterium]|nr:PASTA domain-containing protein [Chitinophagaceae bacterium]